MDLASATFSRQHDEVARTNKSRVPGRESGKTEAGLRAGQDHSAAVEQNDFQCLAVLVSVD